LFELFSPLQLTSILETDRKRFMKNTSVPFHINAQMPWRLNPAKKILTIFLVGTVLILLPRAVIAGTPTVNLGSLGRFAVLAGSAVTSVPSSAIKGDVGISPAARSNITGLTPVEVNGSIFAADDGGAVAAILTQAQGDLTAAYNDAAGRSLDAVNVADADLGGRTLSPGLYKSSGTLGLTGNLTLDGKGDPNAVFIFQMASSLSTAPGSQVILAGGANAGNIFWQVGTSASLATTSVFKGNILADQSIALATGAELEGRALARIGAVTLQSNAITIPVPLRLPPSFGPVHRDVSSAVTLVITNTPGLALTLQYSADFKQWVTLGTPTLNSNPDTYVDTTASPDTKRFYRAFYP
jgi:hypothetical protein